VRILVTSDWHGDRWTMGVPRFPEIERAAHATVDAAIREKVDAWAFLGDLTDPDSGVCVFRCIELLIRCVLRVWEADIDPIVIAGNHDVIEDGSGETSLSPLRALLGSEGTFFLRERPGMIDVRGVPILALPYTATSHRYDPLAQRLDARVVLGHLSVPGIVPGEETLEMPRGREVVLPVDRFPKDAVLINGHYHKQQASGRVLIPGSLARLTHGEERNEPGFLIVEVPS
jgi:DNA repair exonuclease SbcCD nuclease subunit